MGKIKGVTANEERTLTRSSTVAEFFLRTTGAEAARAVGLDDVADRFAEVDLGLDHLDGARGPSPVLLLIEVDRRCESLVAAFRHERSDGPPSELVCRASVLRDVEYRLRSVARNYHTVLTTSHADRALWACSRIDTEVAGIRQDVLGGFHRTGTRPLPLSDTELVCELIGGRVTAYTAIEMARSAELFREPV